MVAGLTNSPLDASLPLGAPPTETPGVATNATPEVEDSSGAAFLEELTGLAGDLTNLGESMVGEPVIEEVPGGEVPGGPVPGGEAPDELSWMLADGEVPALGVEPAGEFPVPENLAPETSDTETQSETTPESEVSEPPEALNGNSIESELPADKPLVSAAEGRRQFPRQGALPQVLPGRGEQISEQRVPSVNVDHADRLAQGRPAGPERGEAGRADQKPAAGPPPESPPAPVDRRVSARPEDTEQTERAPVAFAARLTSRKAVPTNHRPVESAGRLSAPRARAAVSPRSVVARTPPTEFAAEPHAESLRPSRETAASPEQSLRAAEARHSSGLDVATPSARPNGSATATLTPPTFSAPELATKGEPIEAHQNAPVRASASSEPLAAAERWSRAAAGTNRIDVRLQSPRTEGVNVRVVERQGQVHLVVRTPDTDLTASLRASLSNLVSRVQHQGFQAETWHPNEPASLTSTMSAREVAAADPFADGGRGGGDDQRHPQDRQQQERRPAPPSWMDELKPDFGALVQAAQEETTWTQLLRR